MSAKTLSAYTFMATQYRIVEESSDAFFIEASRPFLFFTLWARVRDEHVASRQGYGYGKGAYARYDTVEDAAEAIAYLEAAELGYVLSPRVLAYQ